MNLHWGFFYDSWLIDRVPSVLPLTIEETNNGWRINPAELTMYFGANPYYLYGEGKMYHEVLFCETGMFPMPFIYGRPGLEFISEMSVSLDSSRDWLGRYVGEKMVGRVEVADFIKKYTEKFYGISEANPARIAGVSSELVDFDNASAKLAFAPSFETAFDTVDELRNSFNPVMYLTMYLVENLYTKEMMSGDKVKVITPFTTIYTKEGILKPTINLKNCKLDITKYAKKAFSEDAEEITIFFKTNKYFLGGLVFDYSGTLLEGASNYGFRLYLDRLGLKIVSNQGNKEPDTFQLPIDIDFRTPRAFVINIKYGKYIKVFISGDDVYKFNYKVFKPKFKDIDNDTCILSGFSKSKEYVQTGNFEEFGFATKMMSDDVLNSFLSFNQLLNIAELPEVPESPTPVVDNLMYSLDKSILIPRGVDVKEGIEGYEVDSITPTIDIAKKVYLSNGNKGIREAYLSAPFTHTASLPGREDKSKYSLSELVIRPGEYVFGAYGYPDKAFDDTTEFFKIVKKITSDTHIPMKIKFKFKVPKWVTRQTAGMMQLKLTSVEDIIWYHYKKFKTGEWL